MRKTIRGLLVLMLAVICLAGCSSKYPITLDDQFYGSSDFIVATADELNELEDSDSNYVVYTHNNNCVLLVDARVNIEKYMERYQISMYRIPYDEFKDTFLHDEVKYAPSVIIVSNGKIISYLDAESDDDTEKFKSYDKFREWMNTYVDTKEE